jgi:PAS domain S-box-containing protein
MESKPEYIALIKNLFFALKQIRLYSDDHPMTQETFNKIESELLEYFKKKSKLSLGAMRHRLLVDGSAVNDKESAAHDFAKEMEKLGIEGLVFSKGVDLNEIKKFLNVLGMRQKTLQEKGGFQIVFEQQAMEHISLSKGKFQLVEAGEIVVDANSEINVQENAEIKNDSAKEEKQQSFDILKIISQIQNEKGIQSGSDLSEGVVFNAPLALEQLENNPQELVEAALFEAQDEVKLEQVIRKMSKVLVEGLLSFLVEEGKDVTKALEKLSKEIEKGISKLGEGEEFQNLKKKVPEIFEEATDELRVQMIRKTYENNPDDIKAVEKIAKKLFKDKSVRKRLEPYLKEEASDVGLEASQIEAIFNTLDKQESKKKNRVTIDAFELKELRKKAELYESVVGGDVEKKIQSLEIENKIVRHQKERMDSVIHNLAEGLVVVDENGDVVLMNPAAEKLLGVTQGQKLGQPISQGLGQGAMVSVSKGNLRRNGELEGVQQVQLFGDSEETKKVLQASSAVIENEDGQTVGMVSVLSDITKQKQVDELKSKFVSNVSHELRTPLVAIQKSLSLILEKEVGEITEDQEKFLSIAHRNIDRLSRLINDLLDVQKLDAGQMKINKSIFPVNGVVEHVISTMGTWLKDKKINIERKFGSMQIDVEGDPDRLTQVVTNLLGNALKYTPDEGSIVIDIQDEVVDQKLSIGKCIEIGIKDSGIGIAKQDQNKIFDKFIQVGLTQPAGVSSTGLGLTITKEIIELHGGRIWVESEEGKGSRFAFRIPKKAADASAVK